jgi:hypothetical protein
MLVSKTNPIKTKTRTRTKFTADPVLAELRDQVKRLVEVCPGATVRARLRYAARLLRLPIGRVADWYYGEVRRVEAHEADQIRYYFAEARRQFVELNPHAMSSPQADLG